MSQAPIRSSPPDRQSPRAWTIIGLRRG
jgi:hypothetical protein